MYNTKKTMLIDIEHSFDSLGAHNSAYTYDEHCENEKKNDLLRGVSNGVSTCARALRAPTTTLTLLDVVLEHTQVC